MKKWHYPEAIASLLVVGLGQILKGENKKGIKMLLFFYFALPLAAYLSLAVSGTLFFYVMIFCVVCGLYLWIYSVLNALLKK